MISIKLTRFNYTGLKKDVETDRINIQTPTIAFELYNWQTQASYSNFIIAVQQTEPNDKRIYSQSFIALPYFKKSLHKRD